jgi:hypothetical protein
MALAKPTPTGQPGVPQNGQTVVEEIKPVKASHHFI